MTKHQIQLRIRHRRGRVNKRRAIAAAKKRKTRVDYSIGNLRKRRAKLTETIEDRFLVPDYGPHPSFRKTPGARELRVYDRPALRQTVKAMTGSWVAMDPPVFKKAKK